MIRYLFSLCILTVVLSPCWCVRAKAQPRKWDLNECLRYALGHHPQLAVKDVVLRQSKQNLNAAWGMLLPAISGGVNHSYSLGSTIDPATNQRSSLNVQYNQFYANADMQLLNWRQFYAIGYARLEKQNSLYQREALKVNLSLEVIANYYAYVNNYCWSEILSEQITGLSEQVLRTEKEVAIGNRPKSDVYDIRSNLSTLKEQWLGAKNEERVSKVRLLNSMGINRDSVSFLTTVSRNTNLSPGLDEEQAYNLIQHNPAYRAMLSNQMIARKSVKMATANYLPRLGATYGWSTFYTRNIQASNNVPSFSTQWTQNINQQVSFGLIIPVFNRLQVKTNVANARMDIEKTEYEKQDLVNSLMQSIRIIQIQYKTAWDRVELLNKSFDDQRLSFERSSEKYKEGLIDAYTFFLVRNSWLQARFNLLSSRNNLQMQESLLETYKLAN